jgi:hypothetical protein
MNLATTISIYANRKLHKRVKFQGLDVSVENRVGSVRKGKDPHWGEWSTKMLYDYGYIKGSKGMDGGGVDCFVGPNPSAKMAYVVHIKKLPDFKTFDEDKVMLGFDSKKAAKKAFMAHYDKPDFYGGMDVMPMDIFKKKVLETAKTGPHKIEAETGEPQVYDGGYGHLAVKPTVNAPSLRKPKYVPSPSDPREKDDSFGDVTRRKEKAAQRLRGRLTKQHTDANMRPLSSTLVQGFPSGTVGGFG